MGAEAAESVLMVVASRSLSLHRWLWVDFFDKSLSYDVLQQMMNSVKFYAVSSPNEVCETDNSKAWATGKLTSPVCEMSR